MDDKGIDDCYIIISSRFHSLGVIYDLIVKSVLNKRKVVLVDAIGSSVLDIRAESSFSIFIWKIYRGLIFKVLMYFLNVKCYQFSDFTKSIKDKYKMPPVENERLTKLFEHCATDHFVAIHGRRPTKEEEAIFNNEHNLKEFIKNYNTFIFLNAALKPKNYLFFNGRHPLLIIVDNFQKDLNYQSYRSEILSGATLDTMRIINSSVNFFDFLLFSDFVAERYLEQDKNLREQQAKNYFSRRFANEDYFIAEIAKSWDMSSKIFNNTDGVLKIAFFLSSIDEFPAFKKVDSEINYEDQETILRNVVGILDKHNMKYELLVKIHPRTVREEKLKSDLEIWKNIENSNPSVKIITHNTFSPFQILQQVDLVLASSSTLAVDATYIGKKAVSFGPNFFTNHNATWFCRSWQEFEHILLNEHRILPSENTYPFAWCMEALGDHLNYYSVKKVFGRNLYFLGTKHLKIPVI